MPINSRFNFFIVCFFIFLRFYPRLLPPLDDPELFELLLLEDLVVDPELEELDLELELLLGV